MASGRTHETINLAAFAGIATVYAVARADGTTASFGPWLEPQAFAFFALAYAIGTFLVTPDLDLADRNVQAKRNWGVLGLVWIPYGAMFRHRGLSHSWVLGPLTRLAYMALVALALAHVLTHLAPYFGYAFSVHASYGDSWPYVAAGAAAGYYASQWMHLATDVVGSELRRPARKRR